MANPKASSTTRGYRQTVKSSDESGNVYTTTNYSTDVVREGSVQPRGSSGGGATTIGNPVEIFVVGSLFIWLVVSGKLAAIINAGKA